MKDPQESIEAMIDDLVKEIQEYGPGESQLPEPGSEDSQKFFATAGRLAATAASERAARTLARFRFQPPEPHWWDAVLGVGILYLGFIGLPAAAGIWAAVTIWNELH